MSPTFTLGHLSNKSARNGSPTHNVAEATRTANDHTTADPLTAGGNASEIRMIPILAKGVGSTIPGTQPHRALRD
jgi:hypothetical protein